MPPARLDRSRLLLLLSALVVVGMSRATLAAAPADVSRVLEAGKHLDDPRLKPERTLSDDYHPWQPATTKAGWEKQAQAIRERILVSTGLWPMLPKEPLKPVIHGKINRGEYSIEKVFFASLPGHYVSGNLYRPTKKTGKFPGVLCPYGHWKNGRLYDAGERGAAAQIAEGAERTMAAARYPLQARLAQLARMGCVVFQYDMVGVADSKPIGHAAGFADPEAELRLQSAMGLQTFNSIRALDFLLALPDVDSTRVGVTGQSGGGTQTFILCAIDPRPTVAFPACMVSTNMQGGCVCENSDYLRIGVNNIAFAAAFAPKPLAMNGAHDWTIDIETKGLPEMRQVYGLYGNADLVRAKCFPQFGHNYNRLAREMMENWFNEHLNLGAKTPIVEQDFWPVDPKDLAVFDQAHSRPADAKSAPELRKYLTAVAERQFAELLPKNAAGLPRYREVIGTAARVLFDGGIPDPESIESEMGGPTELEGDVTLYKGIQTRSDDHTQIPWVILRPSSMNGTAILWLDGKGKSALFDDKGQPARPVKKLLDAGNIVASFDLLATGEFVGPAGTAAHLKLNPKYAGYTYAYNHPLLANRVHDILSAIAGLSKNPDRHPKIRLVGIGEAGPCVLLAAGLARERVSEVIADVHGVRLSGISQASDPFFLPGALKYGGLAGLAALAAPTKLDLYGAAEISADDLAPLSAVYRAAGGSLTQKSNPLTPEIAAERLVAVPKTSAESNKP
jgi:hypothetical protein